MSHLNGVIHCYLKKARRRSRTSYAPIGVSFDDDARLFFPKNNKKEFKILSDI